LKQFLGALNADIGKVIDKIGPGYMAEMHP
jgi:hypothetical protein